MLAGSDEHSARTLSFPRQPYSVRSTSPGPSPKNDPLTDTAVTEEQEERRKRWSLLVLKFPRIFQVFLMFLFTFPENLEFSKGFSRNFSCSSVLWFSLIVFKVFRHANFLYSAYSPHAITA